MMIHSTSTTITPMTIQVTAVEDMMRLLAGLRRPQSMGSRNAWEAGDRVAAAGRVATARPRARASAAIGLAGSTVVSRAGGLRQSFVDGIRGADPSAEGLNLRPVSEQSGHRPVTRRDHRGRF